MNRDRTDQLREGVRRAYSAAAENPHDEHPFPVGERFGENLGYPREFLARLSPTSAAAFSGVSNVAIFADIPVGSLVLDLGCGSGLDSLIAAQRVGPNGKVIGIDFSDSMLARARQGAAEAGAHNVRFYQADAENLPIGEGSIDIALVNGIFNLSPGRGAIFVELARVVRQGGAVYAAELILKEPLPPAIQKSEMDWFA